MKRDDEMQKLRDEAKKLEDQTDYAEKYAYDELAEEIGEGTAKDRAHQQDSFALTIRELVGDNIKSTSNFVLAQKMVAKINFLKKKP